MIKVNSTGDNLKKFFILSRDEVVTPSGLTYDSTATKLQFDEQLNGRKVQTNQFTVPWNTGVIFNYVEGEKLFGYQSYDAFKYTDGYGGTPVFDTWDEYVAAGKPRVRATWVHPYGEMMDLTEAHFTDPVFPVKVYSIGSDGVYPNYSDLIQPLQYSRVDVAENSLVEEGTKLITYYYKPTMYAFSPAAPIVVELPE